MHETKAKEIVKTLTLEEKASLTSGAEMFATSCFRGKGDCVRFHVGWTARTA